MQSVKALVAVLAIASTFATLPAHASDGRKAATKVAVTGARIGAGAAIGGTAGKLIAGGAVGTGVGILLTPSKIGCGPGETCR